jgi:iron(III) transport system substrate-binding protein
VLKKNIVNICLVILSFWFTATTGFASEKALIVYSARKEHLVQPVFDLYTKETGVKIKYITDKAPVLLERIKAEGLNCPADLLVTVDAGNLWHAADKNILEPVQSDILSANIPDHLRDSSDRWFGLSVRARTIVYHTDRIKPNDLSTYQDLASPQWKNRLILRTSKKVYNQSLVAMLITDQGEKKTEDIVKGWVANLAAPPFSNDTGVMKAIIAGQGDVGIVNTYYFGRLQKKNPSIPLALFWPNQKSTGVHVNISGAGVVATGKNKREAIAFLEWLSQEKAQKIFADVNMEYPANPNVKVHSVVEGWGTFKQNKNKLENAGKFQGAAIRLMDRAGYK